MLALCSSQQAGPVRPSELSTRVGRVRGICSLSPRRGCVVAVRARTAADELTRADPPKRLGGELPFIGNFHQMDFDQLHFVVDGFHRQMGTQAFELTLFGTPFCHTRDAEDCAQVFREAEVFPKSPILDIVYDWLGDGLASQRDIPKHAEVRRLLNPAFRQDYVRGLNPVFAEVGARLGDALAELGEHDIQDMAARATIDIIGRTGFRYDFGCLDLAMGRRRSGATVEAAGERLDVTKLFDQLLMGAGNLFSYGGILPFRDWIPGYGNYKSAIRKLDAVIDAVIEERRREGVNPEDRDLISYCLRAMEEDETIMTDRQIRNELHTMLFAGSDTTANTLSWMFYSLASRPEMMERCIKEADDLIESGQELTPAVLNSSLPFLTACFKEALRMWPPVAILSRICTRDTVLEGSKSLIRKGTIVTPDVWSVHHNEKYWLKPMEFCPERWLPEGEAEFGEPQEIAFIPFGGGSRICIGKHFAIMEAQVIASQVLRKVKFEPVQGFEPKIALRVTTTSENGIKLKAVPRN